MPNRIMHFLDRSAELARLDRLARRQVGGLVVLYGRRRIGKTRILLEWARRRNGLYTVAGAVPGVPGQAGGEAMRANGTWSAEAWIVSACSSAR